MKGKTWLSMIGLAAGATLVTTLLLISGGTAGEYHVGGQLFCYDCHTMHYSISHEFGSGNAVTSGTPAAGGNWLGATGPNPKLLKLSPNELCNSCHDGQTFAPDVVGISTNTVATAGGRSAGALTTGAGPYEDWKGHTLGSTTRPPGYNNTAVGLTDWYPAGTELECVTCHAAHGSKTAFRNLGSRSISSTSSVRAHYQPTYAISATNDTTKDVWVNLSSYTPGSGNAATFTPYYAAANISFNKTFADPGEVNGSVHSSNRLGTFCAACHANFHGTTGDTASVFDGASGDFSRHPTSGVVVPSRYVNGAAGTQANPGPPTANGRVRVFGDTTNGSPGCITCHKAHGNQNPFGLIFLNQLATTVTEQGGFAPAQITAGTTDTGTGLRNLCWQCHGMGATDAGY